MNQAELVVENERLPIHREIGGERVLKPRKGLGFIDLNELWRYRELFFFLAWRDVLVRYKQTYLGIAWAILQPFLTMVVFTVIFGKLGKFPSNGAPYPLVAFAALLPWQLFSNALTESSNSLVASANMISKIYFPRLIIPASAVISGIVDFACSIVILFFLMLYYRTAFTIELLLLPLFLLHATLSAFAVGVWLSALNVKYRDIKYVVPFLTRVGIYISPVAFLSNIVPERWRLLYDLNPMVCVIDGFRWCILGDAFRPNWQEFGVSTGAVLFLLISGMVYFRSTEKTFADVI